MIHHAQIQISIKVLVKLIHINQLKLGNHLIKLAPKYLLLASKILRPKIIYILIIHLGPTNINQIELEMLTKMNKFRKKIEQYQSNMMIYVFKYTIFIY